MMLVDANILLYAYHAGSPLHREARSFWEARLSEPEPVGLAWATVLAFLRIGTNPRVFERPMTMEEACQHVSAWLQRPMVRLLQPTQRHWEVLRRLLAGSQASGNLVADAHLAATAVEHGAMLCSTDQDFSRFEGLSWKNPLGPSRRS